MALFHLLRPKSSLQTFRLGFLAVRTRCCLSVQELKEEAVVEKTGIIAVEPILIESSKLTPTFISLEEAPYTRLADVFSEHKVDQNATTEDRKGTQQPKGARSDVLFDYYGKHICPDSECLPHSNDPLLSEPVLDSQDGHFDESPPHKCENDQSIVSESDRTDKIHDLKDFYTKKTDNDLAVTEIGEPLGHSSELRQNNQVTVNKPVIKGLIDLLRVQTCPSISTSGNNKKGFLVKENTLNNKLQMSDSNNNRLASWDFHDGPSENDDEGTSNLEIISVDFADAKSSSEISVPTRDKDEKQLNGTGFSREENGVLVRFLNSSTTKSHVLEHFRSCGEIVNIKFRDARGSPLRTAYIYFETKEAVKRALKKSGLFINKYFITVKPATSIENVKIRMPNLTLDPDVPAALVKNPTRTIKIEQLSREISSCHIKEALAFCDCNISGYFMGSSHSLAYVEFETEIGKERALAKHSINILGKPLTMLRIDPPRTTVVRISSVAPLVLPKIMFECRSLGVVRHSIPRNHYVLDVHFGLAEWPNMLKILNRLNGFEVEGTRLQAEPAPVFPSDVLIALWHQPEERKVLKATAHDLLRKIGGNTDTSKFASLQNFFDKI